MALERALLNKRDTTSEHRRRCFHGNDVDLTLKNSR